MNMNKERTFTLITKRVGVSESSRTFGLNIPFSKILFSNSGKRNEMQSKNVELLVVL